MTNLAMVQLTKKKTLENSKMSEACVTNLNRTLRLWGTDRMSSCKFKAPSPFEGWTRTLSTFNHINRYNGSVFNLSAFNVSAFKYLEGRWSYKT